MRRMKRIDQMQPEDTHESPAEDLHWAYVYNNGFKYEVGISSFESGHEEGEGFYLTGRLLKDAIRG